MYLDHFFDIYSQELKTFFKCVPRANTDQYFGETIAYKS